MRTDKDLDQMTEAEQAAYLEANADRLSEIFDFDHPVEVEVTDDLTTTITVRLKPAELKQLSKAAEARGKKLSTFVREAALTIATQPAAKQLPADEQELKAKFSEVIHGLNGIATLVGAN